MGDMSSSVRKETMTTTDAVRTGDLPAAGWVPPTWEEVVAIAEGPAGFRRGAGPEVS